MTKRTVRSGLAPEALELVVQQVARHRVERAERLVHQQHVGVLRQRPRERDALAHAAGELVRPLVAEARRGCTSSSSSSALGRRSALPTPASFSGELDVAARREPREQRGLLEHQRRCGPRTSTRPDVGRSSPATRLSSVLLPQPDAPSRHTNSPGRRRASRRRARAYASPAWPKTFETSSMDDGRTRTPASVGGSPRPTVRCDGVPASRLRCATAVRPLPSGPC